jgi:hypothetical protein
MGKMELLSQVVLVVAAVVPVDQLARQELLCRCPRLLYQTSWVDFQVGLGFKTEIATIQQQAEEEVLGLLVL